MKVGPPIQCQACGASHMTFHHEQSMVECQYCGAMSPFENKQSIRLATNSKKVGFKLWLLLITLPLLVIALASTFWMMFDSTRNHPIIDSEPEKNPAALMPIATTTSQNDTAAEETKPSSNQLSNNESLIVTSEVSSTTTNGGQYWIISLLNTGDQLISHPGVMLSMFNQQGQRIVEQAGWALKEDLPPGEQTTVLVYLSEAPLVESSHELSTFYRPSNNYGLEQVELEVRDYIVSLKNGQYELIGDVVNNHDSLLKYIRILAVAYDSSGNPIGIGNAFSSIKNLEPGQISGFNVRVGTFLVGEPAEWKLWAFGKN